MESDSQSGVTWLELYLMYNLGGWNWQETKEGRRARFKEEANQSGSQTQKWQTHLAKKSKVMNDPAAKFRKEATVRAELDLFKNW